MKNIYFYLISPIDYFRGLIKFPIGFYTFDSCSCLTCKKANGGRPGWGIGFLFFGFSYSFK